VDVLAKPKEEPSPVTKQIADQVGGTYLAARSTPTDPLVVSAYAHLQAETDCLFNALVGRDHRESIRVVFTQCREPYESDRDMIAAVQAGRILQITTASVESVSIHPVLGCELGGPFDRFRAVHDLVGHVRTGFGFGLEDELAAWRVQDSLHSGLARLALATELLAINSARFILGSPPCHKATLLDVDVLERARSSIPKRSWPASVHPRQTEHGVRRLATTAPGLCRSQR
jgi:hypothetical protein